MSIIIPRGSQMASEVRYLTCFVVMFIVYLFVKVVASREGEGAGCRTCLLFLFFFLV